MTRWAGPRYPTATSPTCTGDSALPRGCRAHTTTVAGGNGLYRREVFASVRFDPALREGEDVALNHAIERHGLSLCDRAGPDRRAPGRQDVGRIAAVDVRQRPGRHPATARLPAEYGSRTWRRGIRSLPP